MKSLKTILGIALATAGLGGTIAVGAARGANEEFKMAKAAVSSCYLAGSMTNWGDNKEQMTKSGSAYTISKHMNKGDTFKIVINGSTWVDNYCVNQTDFANYCFASHSDSIADKNIYVNYSGTYNLSFTPSSDTWGSLTITGQVDVKSVKFVGTMTSWSTNARTMTKSGSAYSVSYGAIAAGEEFKILLTDGDNNEYYLGKKSLSTTDNFTKTYFENDGSDSNIPFTYSGNYSFSFTPNEYGNNGVIVVGGSIDTVSTTLSVTFTTDVPDYVDIYIPGSFNSWSSDITVSKMTRTSNRVFTYLISDIIPGNFEYKVVACYSTATEVDYNHQVDTSNQPLAIASSDNGKTKSLGSKSYDFANNMKQETVPEGATITLTFQNAIPNTVDIIYVGGLTNWGTSSERIRAGIMSTNAQRKVFTWDIPSSTYTGTYEYKVVAMSKYTTAEKVSYDHMVYGSSDYNESMTMNSSTLNYPLVGIEADLIELATYSFSEGFNTAMAGPCADPNADNSAAVSAIWGTWKTTFEGMPSNSKSLFGTSQGAMISQARSNYLHCVSRYKLTTWTGAPSGSQTINEVSSNNNNTAVYAIIAVGTSLSLVSGLFFLLRKKKHN